MFKKFKPKITFLIENDQKRFYPGSIVAGVLLVDLPKDLTFLKGNFSN